MQNVQEPLVTIRQLSCKEGHGVSMISRHLINEIDNELQRLGYYHDPDHPTLICTTPIGI
jgi:hypothetical protein